MEIKIVHSADPALLAALVALAGGATAKVTTAVATKATGKATKKEEPEDEAPEEDEDLTGDAEPTVTLEQAREAAQKLIAGGKSAKLKVILKEFGAAKVIDLDKDSYADFLAKVKAVK